MGAAVSSSGSGRQSCREHGGRLKRVDRNDVAGARCGVCHGDVEIAAMRVHRCRTPGCPLVLHDGCFRLPVKVKRRFGRTTQHRLKLDAAGGAGSCSLCDRAFEPHTSEYGCTDPGCPFRVHRRCCNLPPNVSDAALHEHGHGRLVLTSPSHDAGAGGGAAHSSNCLRCGKAAAWSYRCPDSTCKGRICLVCVFGNDDGTGRCGCVGERCGVVDPGCLGEWIGTFLCGIGQGMTGCRWPAGSTSQAR